MCDLACLLLSMNDLRRCMNLKMEGNMKEKQLLCNPFCNPAMIQELEKGMIMEIAPDVWEIEGFAGTMFFIEPPSGNIFILRDGDLVLLMDTGHHPFYRERILGILKKFREEGARELVLVMSHGHWDHGKNNDIIYEAGYEKARFLLPENEFPTLNIPAHMLGDAAKAVEYFDPGRLVAGGFKVFLQWAKNFPEYGDECYREAWALIEALPDEYDSSKTRVAWEALLTKVLCPDLRSYLIDRAEPLTLASREKRTYGGVEFTGWPVGRFFLIHDASQSPGHICIYDPKHKLMITGDATLEINPPFFDCDFGACIDICAKCLMLAEAGGILIAADCHRTSQWWPRSLGAWGVKPLDPLQFVDYARGTGECAAFYRLWLEYFRSLREETLLAASRIGEATVPEIVAELSKSQDRNVVFKFGLRLPNIPSSPEMLVTRVLVESGAARRVEGERILLKAPEKWNFKNV